MYIDNTITKAATNEAFTLALCGSYWLVMNKFIQTHGYTASLSIQLRNLQNMLNALDSFTSHANWTSVVSFPAAVYKLYLAGIWRCSTTYGIWCSLSYRLEILKPIQHLKNSTQILFSVPSVSKESTKALTWKLHQHATTNTVKLEITYTVMVWRLAKIDTLKLWGEKLDGPTLNMEMRK